jgi:hypothetical protein
MAMCCKPVTDVVVMQLQMQMQRSVIDLEERMPRIYHVCTGTHVSARYSE